MNFKTNKYQIYMNFYENWYKKLEKLFYKDKLIIFLIKIKYIFLLRLKRVKIWKFNIKNYIKKN